MGERRDLNLFPLNTVLFPTAPLPLRIFEERYKLMVRRCLEGDRTFGVALIKEGPEVGGPAVPYLVGTQAKIIDAAPLGGGRLRLMTVGVTPFRIAEVTQWEPYLTGKVEFLDYDLDKAACPKQALKRLLEHFRRHVDLLAALSGRQLPEPHLDHSVEQASYIVAATMQVGMLEKQALLETPSTCDRIEKETALLERENVTLRMLIAMKEKGRGQPSVQKGPFGRYISNN
ncbi:MAG: LON peptidase substrate-binding domain-containing protein [Chloroflexi bacterium]|nr:LON peptidase substrate-binding domain-containing protein [Chloroflexota bacterium]